VELVQGQTTLAERYSPGKARAYTCNLELVGQFEGEGAGFDMEVLDDCVYYSTAPSKKLRQPGTVVLDVSDSRHPKMTTRLDSPAMLNPIESLAIEPVRKVMLANQPAYTAAAPFDIYDLSGDCRYPRLVRSLVMPRIMSHAGVFGPDGQLFYSTSWDTPRQRTAGSDASLPPVAAVYAIDMKEASAPREISTWIPEDWKTHSISVSKDGMRAYLAVSWRPAMSDGVKDPHGLAILDISDFQLRRPHPRFRVVSTLFWDETHEAQFILPATIGGVPHLIFTDLTGAIGYQHPASAELCNSGKPGHGFPRIIDISDESKPRVVAKLMLEVAEPANCAKTAQDPTAFFGYGSVACDVDSPEHATMLACGFFEGGLRVFDIRKPNQPREIAYYKPPARRKEERPASMPRAFWGSTDLTADPVIVPRFRGNGEIWFLSTDNAFQVVQFSDSFKAANKDLFVR
jgi:hypothetical protein